VKILPKNAILKKKSGGIYCEIISYENNTYLVKLFDHAKFLSVNLYIDENILREKYNIDDYWKDQRNEKLGNILK